MEIEALTFYEALKHLADRHGIPMPKQDRYSDPDSRLRGGLYEIHEAAAGLFRALLESSAGAGAREYLKRRGVTPATAEEFGLGILGTFGTGTDPPAPKRWPTGPAA